MAEFVTAVGGEDHIAGGRRRDERAQRFEPADDAPTPLRRRLPSRAARRHHDHSGGGAAGASDRDDHVAG